MIPDEVLQLTAGVGCLYVVRRVYVGESVTDLIVTRIEGGALDDYDKPGEELLRVAETPVGWFRAAQLILGTTTAELLDEVGE